MSIKFRNLATEPEAPVVAGYKQKSIDDIADYRNRPWYDRDKLYRVLFFTDTREGWLIEFFIMIGIVVSTSAVFIDSIGNITGTGEKVLRGVQWIFTLAIHNE